MKRKAPPQQTAAPGGFLRGHQVSRLLAVAVPLGMFLVWWSIWGAHGDVVSQREVTAVVLNKRLAPTHTQQDVENRITRPDHITLTGGRVVAGFIVDNPLTGDATEQKRDPATIKVRNIPGNGLVRVKWIVQGGSSFSVTADSEKGGVSTRASR